MRGLIRPLGAFVAGSLLVILLPVPYAAASANVYRPSELRVRPGHLVQRTRVNSLRELQATGQQILAQEAPAFHPATRRGGYSSARTLQPTGAPTAKIEWLRTIDGVDRSLQSYKLGNDQLTKPPDTQLAAHGDILVEATNSSLCVWSRWSAGPLAIYDLNAFFNLSGTYFSDPRVTYDTVSARWFLSGLAVSSGSGNAALLAVSATSDPTGGWITYGWATGAVLPDQPKFAVTTDKLVISWNDYSSPTTFTGQETWVVQKSDLVAGSASPASISFGRDPNRFGLVPAIEETLTSTGYLAYNRNSLTANPYAGPYAGIVRITGTPAANDVVWTEATLSIGTTVWPQPAAQPSTSTTIDSGDDRFLSAEWRNGTLWIGGNDGCIPLGDTVPRACLRLIEASASDTGAALVQNFDVGDPGSYLYYPAVVSDLNGDLFVGYTTSSTTTYPTLDALSLAVGASSLSSHSIALGRGPYDSTSPACQGGRNRWGDYSAAVVDDSHPQDVWVAGEYAPSSTDPCDWGTAFGLVTDAPPTATMVYPASGPGSGGTSVTIFGSEFSLDGTNITFDGAPWTQSFQIASYAQIGLITPRHACGLVPIVISTADGSTMPVYFEYRGYPCAATSSNTGGFHARQGAQPKHLTAATSSTLSTTASAAGASALPSRTPASTSPAVDNQIPVQLADRLIPEMLREIIQRLLAAIH